MKSIQMTCSRCNATMVLENHGGYSSISCPYCGSSTGVLIESDRVKVARIREETERLEMSLSFREHRDYLAEAHARRKIQAAIIGICALIALILIWVFLTQVSVDCPY